MALWDLLNLTCFMIPIAGAVFEARNAKAGMGGWALILVIGLTLGVACTWLMWSVGERIVTAVRAYPESRQRWSLRALYFSAIPWLLGLAFLANVVLSAAVVKFGTFLR